MSTYLLTLLGVIILGVLVDVIVPSGSTSKYISGIFAIFVLFVMVSPILKLVKGEYNINQHFTNIDLQLDNKLLYNINNSKFNALEISMQQQLTDNGYSNVIIDIQFKLVADNVEITQVLVDLTDLVINTNHENINRYVYIRELVQSNIAVDKEVIVFCE